MLVVDAHGDIVDMWHHPCMAYVGAPPNSGRDLPPKTRRAVVMAGTGLEFADSRAAAEAVCASSKSVRSAADLIRQVCDGKRKSAYGRVWRWAE